MSESARIRATKDLKGLVPNLGVYWLGRQDVTLNMAELDYLMSSHVDLEKYVGMWVAVMDRKIIAGDSAKEVYEKAVAEFPNKEPFITKLPKEKVMLL